MMCRSCPRTPVGDVSGPYIKPGGDVIRWIGYAARHGILDADAVRRVSRSGQNALTPPVAGITGPERATHERQGTGRV